MFSYDYEDIPNAVATISIIPSKHQQVHIFLYLHYPWVPKRMLFPMLQHVSKKNLLTAALVRLPICRVNINKTHKFARKPRLGGQYGCTLQMYRKTPRIYIFLIFHMYYRCVSEEQSENSLKHHGNTFVSTHYRAT